MIMPKPNEVANFSKLYWMIFSLLLLIHAALLVWTAWIHSPTIDETAHLPAGLVYWRQGRFDLYRVNPPLVRLVAALPILPLSIRTGSEIPLSLVGQRREFQVGQRFLAENGPRSFWLFTLARCACIPFSLMGGWICGRWAAELWGQSAGLTTVTLWCTCPWMLGNAATIQCDAAAASMAVTTAYLVRAWCRFPSTARAVGLGMVIAISLLVKMTLILFLPLLPVLWLLRRRWDRPEPRQALRHQLFQIVLMTLVALDGLNAGYLFRGSMTRLGDYQFVSTQLSGRTSGNGNRFSRGWLASVPVPLPEDYMLGLDAQRYDFEGHLSSYLRGTFQTSGWWYYYLYGIVIKTPTGTIGLLILAAVVMIKKGPGRTDWTDVLFLIVIACAFLVFVSSWTGLNNHVRYVLPVVPFFLILAGSTGRVFDWRGSTSVIRLGAAAAIAGSVAAGLATFPHGHSYFNIFVGGMGQGHNHLLGSNVDSGEDLLALRDWFRANVPNEPFTLAAVTNFDPSIAGLKFQLPPSLSSLTNPELTASNLPSLAGWHAISVHCLHPPLPPLPDGQGHYSLGSDYSYFALFKPVARIGGAIFIYHLRKEDLDIVRAQFDNLNKPVFH